MIAFRSVWVHVRDRVQRPKRRRVVIAAAIVAAMALLGAPAASGQTPDPRELTAKAFDWNGRWREFFGKHKDPSKAQIESFASELWDEFLGSVEIK